MPFSTPGITHNQLAGLVKRSRLVPRASRLALFAGLPLALGLSLMAGSLEAKNGAVEFAKYFNPIQKKGYLNESQDRVIKKRSFKPGEASDIEAAANKEIGIFASLAPADLANDQLIEDLLAHANVNGLSIIVPWQQLEPAEDEFNWQPIDRVLELAGKHSKSVIVRVSTCGLDLDGKADTPQWVFDAGTKSVPYTGADGNEHQLPIFWDSTYLANWRNFVKALGKRYDKNESVHSIGITGGGILGGTSVMPQLGSSSTAKSSESVAARELEQKLKKDFGMNQRQIVEHWKYVADIFPKYFESARLNFDIDPPIAGRTGQDALDEISDYLIYRYGERIYLTREGVANAKHGFDQYRVLSKFRNDTLTGYQVSPSLPSGDLQKLAKNALDDGISFAEVPSSLLESKEESVQEPLKVLADHIGYEIVTQKASLPQEIPSGQPLKATFTFLNLGAATPMRPTRAFDKDVASSYRILIEVRDGAGKPAVLSLHTPPTPTNQWVAGKPVTYDEELKMPQLAPGEYSVHMWLVDADSKRKLQLLDAVSHDKPTAANSVPLGKLRVVPNNALGSSSPAPN